MASGRIWGSYPGTTKYSLCIDWSSTPNTANNTSSVTAEVKLYKQQADSASFNNYNTTATLSINGNSASKTDVRFDMRSSAVGSFLTLYSRTITVSHNADGKKTINVNCSHDSGLNWGTGTVTGNAVLDTIPRASKPTVSSSRVLLESDVTINMNRASSNFTHTVRYSIGSLSNVNIATNVTSSTPWKPPDTIANQITSNPAERTCTITVLTYNGGTLVGTETCTLTLVVPNTEKYQPTITFNNPTGSNLLSSKYVQGKSTINLSYSSGMKYGASVSSYKISVTGYNTETKSGSTTSASYLAKSSGTNTITVTVVDSRGFTKSSTKSVSVEAYSNPYITRVVAFRCDSSGVRDDIGEFAKIELVGGLSSIGGANTNIEYRIAYRVSGTTTWTSILLASSGSTISTSRIVSVNPDNTFDVQASVKDYYTTTTAKTAIPTAYVTMDYHSSGKGVAFGKVAEVENLMDVAYPIKVTVSGESTTIGHNLVLQEDSNGIPRGRSFLRGVELYGRVGENHGGYVDFHYGGDTSDFTSRIIENESGVLRIQARINPDNMVASSVSITPTANSPSSVTVNYGKTIVGTPTVLCTPGTAAPGSHVVETSFSNQTNTQVTLWVFRTNTTSLAIHYLVYGR